ncbi:MAG: ferritin family protein [Planctomycetota bacterium]
MAEEIEKNGAVFYRKAAENTSDEEIKKMLLDMANMEDGHLATFQEMRKQLSNQEQGWTIFDPDNQSVLYLQAMADARGYEGKITPTKELTGSETPKEILETALNSEKESVVFYFGLKGLVPIKAGRDKVEAIIIEELSHITTLLNKLKSL